ncbi:MAG: DNA polymerase IV [Calditrichia bacterium]|nr:DNA polymerase IV [Calditrichia bacterium]
MQNSWTKIIVHVDLDAFFASVEQLLHPEWRNKPVIVGADPQGGRGRGVVSAASYEARKYGVHSAMPISQAYRLCPQGIYVVPHGNIYREYSQKFFKVLHQFSPLVEGLSIDEAFLDMSGSFSLFGNAEKMGKKIRSEIKKQIQLTASVGIAPCKSVAKIGSDFNKPDGLTIIEPGQIQDFLDPLPVTKLWGIGKQTYQLLLKMGVKTVAQLRSYPREILEKKFGKMGDHIYHMARGEDERDVTPFESVKSVSNEMTFNEDIIDSEIILKTIFGLAEKVGGRLRRSKIRGHTIHLKIRFADFKTNTRSHTLKKSTHLTEDIFSTVEALLEEFLPLESFVRLVGVGVSHLENESGSQLSIWDIADEKKLKMEKVMDQIQDKFGKNIIKHAESLSAKSRKKD